MSLERYEHRAVIAGIGHSAIGRQIDRSALQLTVDSIVAACADAGIDLDDVDGLAAFPTTGAANVPGSASPDELEIQDTLRLITAWHGPSGGGTPLSGAVQAVAAGVARHVVCYRTVKEGNAARHGGGRAAYGSIHPTARGANAWLLPLGALSPACHIAPHAMRYLHDHGITREQLAWIPVTRRAHAARNPDAVYRGPLTVDDYLSARMISSPLCLYDCDVPVDGSTAIVVSTADAAADLRAPVRIDAMAQAISARPAWDQFEDVAELCRASADALWQRTELRPADVDVAQLYDGFSITVAWWLEALGFCGAGEAGDFVAGGERIGLLGELPLNTWGGQLSGGRLHAGFGHVAEAVRQVRGEAEGRQVVDAEVAVVTCAGGIDGGALLLARWR